MKNTLLIGDHILVNKFIYGVRLPYWRNTLIPIKSPQRGDIIVFKYPEDPNKDFIKRVIGAPGDVVEYRDKQLIINGRRVENDVGIHTDPRVIPGAYKKRDNFGPIKIPPNKLFVMGDNRDESYDSRFWGFVDMQAVNGRAFMIYWSWDNSNFGVRWKRLGNLLH
jgi:signal peptidase I